MDLREQLEQALAKARKDGLLAGLPKDAPGEPSPEAKPGGTPAGAAAPPERAIRAWKCGRCGRVHRSVAALDHCSACGNGYLHPVCPKHLVLLHDDGRCARCTATAEAEGVVERWERRQAARQGEARAAEPPPAPPPAPALPAWKCAECGQIHQTATRPEYCPDCGSAQLRAACARHGVFSDAGCPQCQAEERRWREAQEAARRREDEARRRAEVRKSAEVEWTAEVARKPEPPPAPAVEVAAAWRRLVRGFFAYAALVILAVIGALVYGSWSGVSEGEKLLADGKPKEAIAKFQESYAFFRDRREEGIRHAQAQITLGEAQQLFAEKKIPEALQKIALAEKDLARPEVARGLREQIRKSWLDGLQRLAKEEMYEAALAEVQGFATTNPDLAAEGRAALKRECARKLGVLETDPARFPQAVQRAARLKMIYPEESDRALERIAAKWRDHIERDLLRQRKFTEAAESSRALQGALPAKGQQAAQSVRAVWMQEAYDLVYAGKLEQALAEAEKMEPFFAEARTVKENVRARWTQQVNGQLSQKRYPEAAREAERLRATFEADSKALREKVEHDWAAAARALPPPDGVAMSRKLAEFFPATGGQLEPELVAAWQKGATVFVENGDLRRALAESEAMEKLKLSDAAQAVRDLILAKVRGTSEEGLLTYTYELRNGRRVTAYLVKDLGTALAVKLPDGGAELIPRAEILASVRQPGTPWTRKP